MKCILATEEDIQLLWTVGHTEQVWPLQDRSWEAFQTFAMEYWLACTLGEGGVYSVWDESTLCGYVVLQRIAAHYLPEAVVGMECGTYLLSNARGSGINAYVKHELLSLAFNQFQADWCVFVIPATNHRAMRALDKLEWPFHKQPSNTQASSPQSSSRVAWFVTYVKRKSWEVGQPVILYALHRGDMTFVKSH